MKKCFVLILLFFTVLHLGIPAQAGELRQNAASAELPIKVKIVNLTTMPVKDALQFCNERHIACPAIREKQRLERKRIAIRPEADSTAVIGF